ncbi:MAG: hypothetical protein ACF8Q5_15185 [Phycisphaerales bacterium JB040]
MPPDDPHTPHNPTPADATRRQDRTAQRPKKPSLLRSLGQFTGHIVSGITTKPGDPAKPQRTETNREVEEETRTTEDGRTVTLRRTTIEEVEFRDGPH